MHTTDKHIIIWSINIFCGINYCAHIKLEVGAYKFLFKSGTEFTVYYKGTEVCNPILNFSHICGFVIKLKW